MEEAKRVLSFFLKKTDYLVLKAELFLSTPNTMRDTTTGAIQQKVVKIKYCRYPMACCNEPEIIIPHITDNVVSDKQSG